MHRIVRAELYKLFKNKTFKVLCGVVILMSIITVVFSSPFMKNVIMGSMGDIPHEENEMVIDNTIDKEEASKGVITTGEIGVSINAKDSANPTALEIFHGSFGSGIIEILIGILIAGLLAKEYSQGTIKNTLAYGKKRYEFYIAKFIAIVIGVTILMTLLSMISTIGSVIMNGWGQAFEVSQILGMGQSFVGAVFANSAVIAVIMIFAILVKSNGGTIAITAGIFIFLPNVLAFYHGINPWFDKIYELTPFYNSALATSINSSSGDIIRAIFVAAVTIVIGLLVGTQIFKKQDIK